jgi:VanZ family protein
MAKWIKVFDAFSLLAYGGFIYYLSDQGSLPAPMWFGYQDKLYHAGAYFILAALLWRNLRHVIAQPIILAAACIILASLYGGSDEWHQSFVVGRSSDGLDWLADTIGASGAVILLTKLRKS